MKKLLSLLGLLALTACGTSDQAPTSVKVGKPYTIAGETYTPEVNPFYDEEGIASWYGPGFHGNKTANGERFDTEAMTAAHPTLPMPSLVRVTNLKNGKDVVVRINDRGPFKPGRIIDLSRAAARELNIDGIAQVRVQYLKDETEQYWAENNLSTKQVRFAKNSPVPKSVPEQDNETDIAMNESVDEATQESTAPVLSVSSNDLPSPTKGKAQKSSGFTLVRSANAAPAPSRSQSESDVNSVYEALDDASEAKGYLVQAGAFSSRANADKLVNKLSAVGSAKVVKNTDSALYRVILSAASKEEAEKLKGHAHDIGIADARIITQ